MNTHTLKLGWFTIMRAHVMKMASKTPTCLLLRYFTSAEHSDHSRTLLALPKALSLYPHRLRGARYKILSIADTASGFDPVAMFVHRDG